MTRRRVNRRLAAATAELAARDPVIARLVELTGPCRLDERMGERPHFTALCRSVTFQQLAGRAASVIYGRVCDTLGGEPTPEAVLAAAPEALRAAGLSGATLRTIQALAASAEVFDGIDDLGDEEIVTRLSALPGIGRWTAEMFLMFQLGRLDVWPVGDLGVRKGYARAYGLPEMPTPKELLPLGERFSPYRSVAAWYCWRAAETVLPAD